MSNFMSTLSGSSAFDYTRADSVVHSVTTAIEDLEEAAIATGGEVVWSSLTVDFSVQTVEEPTLTSRHPRIHPGRATVVASAQAIIAEGGGDE